MIEARGRDWTVKSESDSAYQHRIEMEDLQLKIEREFGRGPTMQFHNRPNGGFAITTIYGVFEFKNLQKFYKFQLLCTHPECNWYGDDVIQEKVCERCTLGLEARKKPSIAKLGG